MKSILEELRETIENAVPRLHAITDEQARMRPEPGRWSPKEVLGHLIDSAANNHPRFIKGQIGDDLVLPGYDQEAWVELQRYRDEPWEQIVALWLLYNVHLVHVIAQISDQVANRPHERHSLDTIAWQRVPADEPATLAYLIGDYIGHMRHHLLQIDPSLQFGTSGHPKGSRPEGEEPDRLP